VGTLTNGLDFLVLEREDLARHYLDLAIAGGTYILENTPPPGEPPAGLQDRREKVGGRRKRRSEEDGLAATLWAKPSGERLLLMNYLRYALWIRTRERPAELHNECVELAKLLYEVDGWIFGQTSIYRIMMAMMENGDYAGAEAFCVAELPNVPTRSEEDEAEHLRKWGRIDKEILLLFTLARYGQGWRDRSEDVRQAMELQHERCRIWGAGYQPGSSLRTERFQWAYLRARLFTGEDDVVAIWRGLRGY
jgi:hypothetical protein